MNIVRLTEYFVRIQVIILVIIGGMFNANKIHATGLFAPLEPIKALYDIDCSVKFDTTAAFVSGEELISLTNTSALPMEQLAFDWKMDSLHTLSVSVNGRNVEIRTPEPGDDQYDPIIIQLPEKVNSGEKLEIKAQFQRTFPIKPNDFRHIWAYWYPRIYWGVQHQDDFIVRLENNSDYVVATSGSYNAETDTYRATGVKKFGLFFCKGAEVMEENAGDIAIRITCRPAGVECARLIMETAVRAIAFYKDRFVFYPSDHLEIVQGTDAPSGGYPAATNLVAIHGLERMDEVDELHWKWITAHEIGHQYWSEYVLPEQPEQYGWLMIGLGIYIDREFARHSGWAEDKHIDLMKGFVDGIREGVDTRADVQRDYLKDIDFDFNNIVVHGKGYSIISALNCILGDELFDRIHSRCLREFAGKRMGFYDFRAVCEEESGQDLDWFFDQWVRATRYPAYEIKSQVCRSAGDNYVTNIMVERTGTLDMPVPVTAYFSDGTEQTEFSGRMRRVSSLRFESTAELDSAVIDAKHEIAMVSSPPDTVELKIRKTVSTLPPRTLIDSLSQFAAQALKLNIEQTAFWGKLGRRLYDWELYDDALVVFKHRTKLLEEMGTEWVASAYGWQGMLLDLLDRRAEAIEAYEKALEIETDREFSYDGDPVTITREWLKERIKTPYQRE